MSLSSQTPYVGWGTCQLMLLPRKGHPGMSLSRYQEGGLGLDLRGESGQGPETQQCLRITYSPAAQGPTNLPGIPHLRPVGPDGRSLLPQRRQGPFPVEGQRG